MKSLWTDRAATMILGVLACLSAGCGRSGHTDPHSPPALAGWDAHGDDGRHRFIVHDAFTIEDVLNRHRAQWTIAFRWNSRWEGNVLRITDLDGPVVSAEAARGSGWADLKVWVEKADARPAAYLAATDCLPDGCEQEVLTYCFFVIRFEKTTPLPGTLSDVLPRGNGYVAIRCMIAADGRASYQVVTQGRVYEGDAVRTELHSGGRIEQGRTPLPPRT